MVTGASVQPISSGTARRVRNSTTPSPNFTVMTTVVCDQCGERFQISHRAPMENEALALRQATWLADRFVWDHIQENKHPFSIELPALTEKA